MKEGMSDKIARLEKTVTTLLRLGVLCSTATILTGVFLSALHHPKLLFSHSELARLVAPGAAFPHAYADLLHGVVALQGQALTTVGILILLALPPLRVACAGLFFIYQKDRVYMLVTVGVLSLLTLSLFLGKKG